MFERELRDLSFIRRWSIVRTIRDQNVAEHSYYVAMYANDICSWLQLDKEFTLGVLKYALWHDVDELFTGDLPGPNKRALLDGEARINWDKNLFAWLHRVFDNLSRRRMDTIYRRGTKSVVKVADWLEAAMFMAGEMQLGNQTAFGHVNHDLAMCIKAADQMFEDLNIRDESVIDSFKTIVTQAVGNASQGRSRGPYITDEMTNGG